MYQYSSPQPGWSAYDYTTSPPSSPYYQSAVPQYYQSFYVPPAATPRSQSKRHSRRASHASPREFGRSSTYPDYKEAIPEYASPRKYDNVPPLHEKDVPRSHARRASTSTRAAPPSSRTPTPPKPSGKATEADIKAAGIPPGYSTKNWDPDETPILVAGSVFDANSLGKWIYDWSHYYFNGPHPMVDLAGELWMLLIKLSGKIKRADEYIMRHKGYETAELLNGFAASGRRLWKRLTSLLKACEAYMYHAAERKSGTRSRMQFGPDSGCEFVKSMFGIDRKLTETEDLMASIHLWDTRFDANCEDILRTSRKSSRRQSTA